MKRTILIIAMLLGIVSLLSAADLTGKWSGQFDFNGTNVPLTFDLHSTGATLTGVISGLPTDNCEIKDGKIDGSTITFWLMTEYQGSPIKLVWTGKISAGQIDFTMGTEDGGFSVSFPAKKGAA
jgi:hypothetical protein